MGIRSLLKQSRYPGSLRRGWVGGDDVEPVEDIGQLTAFFADWTGKYHLSLYKGLHFATEYKGAYTPVWAFLFGLWYGVVDRVRYFKAPGIYARVWLPRSLGLDLHLVSRRRVSPLAGNFYSQFKVDVVDRDLFEEFCSDEFKEALMELRREHQIRMNDNSIMIGPFLRTPAESAEALDLLIKTVPRPTDDEEPIPDYFAEVEKDEGAVIVKVAASTLEADLGRAMLLGEGIPCTMIGYEQSRVWGYTPGFSVKLLVPKSYAEKADEVLNAEIIDESCEDGFEGTED